MRLICLSTALLARNNRFDIVATIKLRVPFYRRTIMHEAALNIRIRVLILNNVKL